MGSNRKGRRHHHTTHGNHHHQPSISTLDEDPNEDDSTEMEEDHSHIRSLDFSKVLQDVEETVVTGLGAVVGVDVMKPRSSRDNNNHGNSAHNNHNYQQYGHVDSSSSSLWSSYSQGLGRECLWLGVAVVSLACLSIFMGVAAGITISIHYFDTSSSLGLPRMEARERDFGAHQRVTNWDPTIASSNIMVPKNPPPFLLSALEYADNQQDSDEAANDEEYFDDMQYDISDLTLGRVITMTEHGRRNVLLVVEEATPLHAEVNDSDHPTTPYGSQQQQSNSYCSATGFHSSSQTRSIQEDEELPILRQYGYQPYRHSGPPNMEMRFSSVHPQLCPDGKTVGFRDWETLKKAVEEANALSAERFMKWNEYYAGLNGNNAADACSADNDRRMPLASNVGSYYEDTIVFNICPGATLRARRGPIFINAENVVIECGTSGEYYNAQDYYQAEYSSGNRNGQEDTNDNTTTCRIAVGGTHLAFGPHAKNILVRGITFQQASTSSLTFYYDGAQASFEDCLWTVDNQSSDGTLYGAVADVNSTSQVNFYRCDTIGSANKGRGLFGGGSSFGKKGGASGNGNGGGQTNSNQASLAALAPGFASFLALRT